MKRPAWFAIVVLVLGVAFIAYAGLGATMPQDENPITIHRLLNKFFEAQATAPFRYPTACVAGTAEEYTEMALRAALPDAGNAELNLWTVPEEFGPVSHPEPDRKSGRCDYRISSSGGSQDAHFIAEFFSRKHPRTGEIAYAKVWQQGAHEAVLVSFPNGPRGANPDIKFKTIPVNSPIGANP